MSLKRENWIDWAKTIGIILVVLGHMHIDPLARDFIYAFHMPLFFIVSGYLFTPSLDNSYKKHVLKDAKRLLIPYLFFGVLSVLIFTTAEFLMSLWRGIPAFDTLVLLKSLAGVLLGNGLSTDYTVVRNGSLWFLPALFFTCILYRAISKCKEGTKILCCIVAVVLVMWFKRRDEFPSFSLGSALLALPLFYVGTLFRRARMIGFLKGHRLFDIAFSLVCLVILCLVVRWNGHVEMYVFQYNNIGLFFVGGIVGTAWIFSLCVLLDKINWKYIYTISTGTLLILAMHLFLLIVCIRFFRGLTGENEMPLSWGIVFSLLIVSTFYFPILFCLKYYPFLLGKPRHPSARQ